MQVQSTNPFASMTTTTPSSKGTTTPSTSGSNNSLPLGSGGTPTESMFLQLLVAQLQYQDPTNPQDPTQFVGELAQFSQLEQTLGIRQDTDTIVSDLTAGATNASATTTPTTTPSTNSSQSPTSAS